VKNKNQLGNQKILLTWIVCMIGFLAITQILFSIQAPCKWLEAVWGAGDFIAFIGTVTLGIVAWLQSKMANETSQKLIDLQATEYLPVITLRDFVGLTKLGVTSVYEDIKTDICIAEMRKPDKELILAYVLNILCDELDLNKTIYSRIYELHFKYLSKTVISTPVIKSISFLGNNFNKKFLINKSIDMSLFNEQEFQFYIYFLSNSDFLLADSLPGKLIEAGKMVIDLEFESLTHKKYYEKLTVSKHLVVKPEKDLNMENIERLISTSYEVKEELANGKNENGVD